MLTFPSQGLSSILQKIQSSRSRNTILDMGEMRPGTFNYFSKLSCKIHFENLRALFLEIQAKPEITFKQQLDTYLIEYELNTKFDVIFLWDLTNFLSIEEIVYLFKKLQPYCKSNTLIHSLSYIGKLAPDSPSKFQVGANGEIQVENMGKMIPKKSNITTLSILKNLDSFMMETNLFNSNSVSSGISENILKYVPHYNIKDKTLDKKNYAFKQNGVESFYRKTTEKLNGQHHFTPAIESIINSIKQPARIKLLDLGKDISENNDFLLNFSSQVFNENLSRFVDCNHQAVKFKMSKQTLVYDKNIYFDAIFTWDLFNYLEFDDLKSIGDRLAEVCKVGTKIYVLAYSSAQRPSRPQSFYIKSASDLEFHASEHLVENREKINSVRLLRAFKNAKIKKTYLMQQNMQKGFCEYVLEYH